MAGAGGDDVTSGGVSAVASGGAVEGGESGAAAGPVAAATCARDSPSDGGALGGEDIGGVG